MSTSSTFSCMRQIQMLNVDQLKRYYQMDTTVGLVPVQTVVQYLNKFYTNPELRSKEGQYVQKKILDLCNPEKVKTDLLRLIDSFL